MRTNKATRQSLAISRISAEICRRAAAAGIPVKTFEITNAVPLWYRAAESIRRRLENECSYEWADTPAYKKTTETKTKNLIESIRALGLYAYAQGDCRGALLYVDAAPITGDDYPRAVCVCLPD